MYTLSLTIEADVRDEETGYDVLTAVGFIFRAYRAKVHLGMREHHVLVWADISDLSENICHDIVEGMDLILSYMADNVIVTSHTEHYPAESSTA